jgi:hypothetical protein
MERTAPAALHPGPPLALKDARPMSRRSMLAMLGLMAIAGCSGGGTSGSVYLGDPWYDPFDDDDWIYYHEDHDEDFLAGLSDEQKEELQQRWDALPDEEKQQIRDRWGQLSIEERTQVRQAWEQLDAGQRQQVISSMEDRIHSGKLQTVTPAQAGPSRFQARSGSSYSGGRSASSGRSYGGGGFGGRAGGGGSFGGRAGGGGRR